MSILVSFPLDSYRRYAAAAFDAFAPTANFTIENARALMWFAQLAYEYETDDQDKIADVRALWKFDRITPFESKKNELSATYDSHGLIGEGRGAVLLAFAGTDPLIWETVATDLRTVPNPEDIHAGFAVATGAVKDKIDQAVAISRQRQQPLLITGHSLGAAMAAIAAEMAYDAGHAPVAVYTYGMPRTGGKTFKARYDEKKLSGITYRLVNGPDIVPTVPPSFLGYLHVGRLLWCGTDRTFDPAGLLETTDSNEPGLGPSLLKTLRDGLVSIAKRRMSSPEGPGPLGRLFKYLPLNVRDHLQDQYLRALGFDIVF
jgi:triacylglycerol lipase